MEPLAKRILICIAEGCEDFETVIPISVLNKAGAAVILCKIPDQNEPEPVSLEIMLNRGTQLICDKLISEILAEKSQNFDMIYIPGGKPGIDVMAKNENLIKFLKMQKIADNWLAASSAASAVVLSQNGLLEDESATTYPGFDYLLKKKDKIKHDISISNKSSIF